MPLGDRRTILSYPRLPGTWAPSFGGHLVAAARALKKVAKAGLVHGDIRLLNFVFAPIVNGEPCVAHLIDFDHCRPINTPYPVSFSTTIPDGVRHHDAVRDKPMLHMHDCFSFFHLLQLTEPTDAKLRLGYRQLLEVMATELENPTFLRQVKTHLKPFYDCPFHLTAEASSLLATYRLGMD
jgi:hypothetical protein